MPRRDDLNGNDIFVIHEFLTPAECQYYIIGSESAGYGDAPITTASGFVMRKDIRNNDRAMIDDPALAAELFGRLRPFLPSNFREWLPVGVNERFRYYRYTAGQKFDWHFDGAFARENGEMSKYTFMIYLNDECTGGETLFNLNKYGPVRDSDASLRVKLTTGMALLFRHDVLHTGDVVLSGTKYVLRTDVMYRVP